MTTLRIRRTADKHRLMTVLRGGNPDAMPYFDFEIAGHVVDAFGAN